MTLARAEHTQPSDQSAKPVERIWDAISGVQVRQLIGYGCDELDNCAVKSAAFSPDGQLIVTASEDGTARIWAASSDDVLAEAARLIQRDPPLLTPEERARFGLE